MRRLNLVGLNRQPPGHVQAGPADRLALGQLDIFETIMWKIGQTVHISFRLQVECTAVHSTGMVTIIWSSEVMTAGRARGDD
jgi:hypothetical protein